MYAYVCVHACIRIYTKQERNAAQTQQDASELGVRAQYICIYTHILVHKKCVRVCTCIYTYIHNTGTHSARANRRSRRLMMSSYYALCVFMYVCVCVCIKSQSTLSNVFILCIVCVHVCVCMCVHRELITLSASYDTFYYAHIPTYACIYTTQAHTLQELIPALDTLHAQVFASFGYDPSRDSGREIRVN
jgi:hypothetical protein